MRSYLSATDLSSVRERRATAAPRSRERRSIALHSRFSDAIFTIRTRSLRLHLHLPVRILALRVLAAAQRQRDRRDDRDQQDHRRDLERVDVVA